MIEAKEFLKQNIFDVHDSQVLDYMLEAKNHLKDTVSRLESLEKDAGRYRWLRNETDLVAGWHGGIALAGFAKTEKHQSELDVAIDTAMQANKGE